MLRLDQRSISGPNSCGIHCVADGSNRGKLSERGVGGRAEWDKHFSEKLVSNIGIPYQGIEGNPFFFFMVRSTEEGVRGPGYFDEEC